MDLRNFGPLLLIAAIAVTAYALYEPAQSPTGWSIASFSAAVQVVSVTFDTNNTQQLDLVVANGPDIRIRLNISYMPVAAMNATIGVPVAYQGGHSWMQNVSGQWRNITAGNNLLVELDATGVALIEATIPSPFLSVESVNITNDTYEQQVRVGSEPHLTNISANTTVSAAFSTYRLYELNMGEVDKTQEYSLFVNGTAVSWSRFNLSTKIFVIRGSNPTTAPSAGGGGSGGGGGGGVPNPAPTNISSPDSSTTTSDTSSIATTEPSFTVSPEWFDVELDEGGAANVTIRIENRANYSQVFTLKSTAPMVSAVQRDATVAARGSIVVPIIVAPLASGSWQSRILISNGNEQHQVFINTIMRGSALTSPAVERPSRTAADYLMNGNLIVLVTIVFFATVFYLVTYTRAPKR